jgi:hypothetical protein
MCICVWRKKKKKEKRGKELQDANGWKGSGEGRSNIGTCWLDINDDQMDKSFNAPCQFIVVGFKKKKDRPFNNKKTFENKTISSSMKHSCVMWALKENLSYFVCFMIQHLYVILWV